jgi:DNA-binding GntR family transcriptional regulator
MNDDELIEAIARAQGGSRLRARELLQNSPRRAHALLRAAIRRGLIPASQSVEEHSLMLSMRMNRTSIRAALQQLNDEGLVSRKQRLGTSIVGGISRVPLLEFLPVEGWQSARGEEDAGWGEPMHVDHREWLEIEAEDYVAECLELEDRRVMMQEDVLRREGEPLAILVGYYPIRRSGDADELDSDIRIDLLRSLSSASFEATVEAINCDERSAKILGVNPGAAMLVRETIVREPDGTPLLLAFGHYRGDRVAMWARDAGVPGMRATNS